MNIPERYGDEYPIIWYDPEIETEPKKNLKDFIQGQKSMHSFRFYLEALEFAKSLAISFILIIPPDFDERKLFEDFKSLEMTSGRRMSKFEEERLMEDFIKETSDGTIKANKVYVFSTLLDSLTETGPKSEERDVTVIGNINDMAEQFRQEYVIILYDPNMNFEIKQRLIQELEIEIEERNIYTELTDLLQEMKSYTGPAYHLIMVGKNLREFHVNELVGLQDLLGLYIYSEGFEFNRISKRNVSIARVLEELISKIKEGIRTKSKLRNTFPTFATNFDSLDRSYLYYLHHYLKGFINFRNREQAKEDFIKLGRKIYQSSKLLRFQDEYNQYNKNNMFYWYAAESPVYKLINNCLRIASSDSILYCRFILKDLEEAIREQYREKSHSFNGLVYRGAYLSAEEWEKLQRNIGKEIEMYGFLSTAASPKIAKNFLRSDHENKVLITIVAPPLPELDDQGFAEMPRFSQMIDEKEILFNVMSKFQILQAETVEIDNLGAKVRHLVLLFGAHLLRKYMTENQPLISIELDLCAQENLQCARCGSDINLFGFQQAATQILCFECLIQSSIPNNIPIIALDGKNDKHIVTKFKGKRLKFTQETPNFSLSGYICCDCRERGKEKYFKWITPDGKELRQCSECFQERKEIKSQILFSESSPFTLWTECQEEWEKTNSHYVAKLSGGEKRLNEGEVYLEVQDFNRGIEYGNKVLDSLKYKRCREGEKARTFEMIGRAYESLGKFNDALESHLNALEIRKAFDQENPVATISSYHNVALAYQSLGQYQKALNYQIITLDIAKKVYGELHTETATSYHYIASTYQRVEEYEKAKEYQEKALRIRRLTYSESHPETAKSYNNLALMNASLKEYDKALEHHHKSLDILISIYGKRHPDVATLYNNIGLVYRDQDEYEEAMKWNKEALEIVKSIYGENHPRIGIAYSNIASTYEAIGWDVAALNHHLKALGVLKDFYDQNSPRMKAVYDSIIVGYKNLKKFEKAAYYEAILKNNDGLENNRQYRENDQNQRHHQEEYNIKVGYKDLRNSENAAQYEGILKKNHLTENNEQRIENDKNQRYHQEEQKQNYKQQYSDENDCGGEQRNDDEENSLVIWYDPELAFPSGQEKLDKILPILNIEEENMYLYWKFEKLLERISNLNDHPCHLIIKSKKILNQFLNMNNLKGLYIYDSSLETGERIHEKVFIAKEMEDLIPKIQERRKANLHRKSKHVDKEVIIAKEIKYFIPKIQERLEDNAQLVDKEIIIKCSIEEMTKAFFKDYVIVWFEPDLNNQENHQRIAQLQKFCEVFTFTEWQSANRYIQTTQAICHVITSGTDGELFVKEISLSQSVESIYVYCTDREYHSTWARNYHKISCFETNIENFLDKIQQNLLGWYQEASSLKLNLPAFAPVFNESEKSQVNPLHNFLKAIPNFNNQIQAKNDFINLSKAIFSDTENLLLISEFEQSYTDYNKEKILKWYTQESFLYKVANNCLKIATSDSIQYGRFPLKNLQRAIKDHYRTKSKNFNGLLYGGAYFSEAEWVNLKENVNREIEMHGFFSASKEKMLALKFMEVDPNRKAFITIIIPKGPNDEEEQGFAEVEEFSKYPDEKEVLFNVRSRFTILETEEKYSEAFPFRHLVLLYGAQGFRKFVAEQNSVQEIVIPHPRNISCNSCKTTPERLIFIPITDAQKKTYYCRNCINENDGPFLSVPIVDKIVGPCIVKIKGCKLTTSNHTDYPFYGYKCHECDAKKQKLYFTCANCIETKRTWCEGCFKEGKLKCMEADHDFILETKPLSFWP